MAEATYRIYVASLSDYNAGVLHGAWIDCDNKDADELQDEVNAILRSSKYPNVTVECPTCEGDPVLSDESDPERQTFCTACNGKGSVHSAEEYAIHDHEGFGGLIGEYTSLETVADIVETLEGCDDPDALKAFADNYGYSISDAAEKFEGAYWGHWESEREYAEDLIDSCGGLDDMPEHLRNYFDYEAFARDLFLDGYTFVNGYVFTDYH